MFIVVESGSTKADWMVIDGTREVAYNTMGFNPYFHTKEDILVELNDHLELDLVKSRVKEIFFYGAGCSSPSMNKVIESALSTFFKNAEVHVDHDLMACAVSCYEDRPVISCIIGTGSNSAYFDGEKIREEVPALSYILGDEGSGCYFGKRLLADFLYNRVPDQISRDLSQMGLTKDVIVDNVYMKPNPNVYIASFMPILIRHKSLSYSQEIIKEGFRKFIEAHVLCFEEAKSSQVSFVGSIASLLEQELGEVCEEYNLKLGVVIRRPLDRLVSYHKDRLEQSNEFIRLRSSAS